MNTEKIEKTLNSLYKAYELVNSAQKDLVTAGVDDFLYIDTNLKLYQTEVKLLSAIAGLKQKYWS